MEPNAILAINSLDRYNKNQGVGGQFASFSASLERQYDLTGEPCNNFQVGGFGALIYGYIKKIQVSQTQLEYAVPTVVPDRNDTLVISILNTQPPNNIVTVQLTIPLGYYTPQEMAAILQILINASEIVSYTNLYVSFRPSYNDYEFAAEPFQDQPQYLIYFPDVPFLKTWFGPTQPNDYLKVLRCYRLLGINIINDTPSIIQASAGSINFLYTPYVDIFSTALTKYQKVKDNTTSASSDSTIIARIFLSGEGTPQNTGGEYAGGALPGGSPLPLTGQTYPLGSRPFVVVQDANSPKVIRWSRDETVYALDFQLRDQYGDLLYTTTGGVNQPTYYTEFQMTLMCIEGGRE